MLSPAVPLPDLRQGPHQKAEAGGRQSGVGLLWRLVHGALVLVLHPRKKEGEEAEWGKDRDNWKTGNQTGLVNKTSPNTLHTFADKDTGQAQPDHKHLLLLMRTCSVSLRSLKSVLSVGVLPTATYPHPAENKTAVAVLWLSLPPSLHPSP